MTRPQAWIILAVAALLSLASANRAALIGYWNFDEGTGTTARDTSGRATPLNGTLSSGGAGLPLWTAGRFGKALDFNQGPGNAVASGGVVTVPYNVDVRLDGAFTISFWWRPDYVPAASTFPGIVRIGNQSAVPPAANAGWGFFRSQPNTARFKRGNHQPDIWRPALSVGQWHHVAVTHDGAGNNVAYVNGQTATFQTNWPAGTTTANLEFGRMDGFDDAGLDDMALFNEGLSLGKMRSLYTVPTSLGIDYDLAKMRAVWAVFDGGPGSSAVVDGVTWSYTTTLPGSTTVGDAYLDGNQWYVVLATGAGVQADVALVGNVSPGGIGLPGTFSFNPAPPVSPTAVFTFDLGSTTTIGGGVSDLLDLTGDLALAGNTVVINPLGPLANGAYRLFNYTGTKTGSLNPAVQHNTRYSLTLDESTAGQINLIVAEANANLTWASTANANWNLSTSNWLNTATTSADRFFDGDTVRFDDSGADQTNVNVALSLYPGSVLVDSIGLNYTIGGAPLSGMDGGLTKNGTSLLNLGGANIFIGPVNLNDGTLRLTSAGALGSTNGSTVIASGATLDLNGQAPGAEPVTVSGVGVGGLGAIVNNGAGSTADALRNVTLTGDTTFGGSGRWDFTGTLTGNGHKLTKVGANEIWIQPLGGDTGLGDIEIQQGAIGVEGVNFPALGNPASTLTVQSNAIFAFWALNNAGSPMAKTVVMNNGTWRNDNGSNYFDGSVTLNQSNVFTMSATLHQLGSLVGDGSLTKLGSGTLVLAGANTYTGPTRVNAGTVALLNDGSVAGSAEIAVASGATLNAATRTDGTLTLASGQILSGSGTVQGNVVAGTASILMPGTSAGTLTITNGLSLTGGSLLTYELNSATTEGGGVNDLINVGGALGLADTTTIKVVPLAALNLGSPYTLINYVGSLSGSAANFTVSSDTRATFSVDTTTTPGKVLLQASGTGAVPLTWAGGNAAAPTAWDVRTTPNWVAGAPGELFYAGDSVTFNDSATEFNVTLVGDLSPADMLVDAAGHDYVFAGSGRIRGGGLTKSSGGRLTLANDGLNDYPGQTTINAGTVQVGVGGTGGSLGPAPIVNNGTLVYDRGDAVAFVNTMTGTGIFEKRGTNLLTLSAAVSGFDGLFAASDGILRPLNSNSLGTVVGGTVVNAGGTLDVNGLLLNREAFTVRGAGANGTGAVINLGAAQQNALRYLTLSGDTALGGVNRWDLRGAPSTFEGNNFNLTKVGPNEIWLVDAGETELIDISVNQGTLGIQGTTTLGDQFGDITVGPGARLGFWGLNANVLRKTAFLNSGIINNGNGNNTFTGDIQLTGSNSIVIAAATTLTITDPVTGTGSWNVSGGAGTNWLLSENTYSGGTTIAAGGSVLELGNGGTTGSILGDVVDDSWLSFNRSDEVTLANNISGVGGLFIRTAAGLVLDGTKTVNLTGNVEVGRNVPGKLVIRSGASHTMGRINLGNIGGTVGEVIHEGGDVTVTTDTRVGHWPNEHSTYLMGGGTLTLTGIPAGVVNPGGQPEQNGVLYIGIDGTGTFTQTGGIASAHGIVFDGRGATTGPGIDTLNLEGGTFVVGPSGLKSGNLDANQNYQIFLGGGTVASSGNWTSVLNMTITGTNGSVTFDTAGHTNVLLGTLAGVPGQTVPGGLIKTGSGALALVGTNTYEGATTVNEGILAVIGSVGAGFAELRVTGGALAGTGTVNVHTFIEAGGTLAPGISIGTLTMINDLSLAGTTFMEIDKTGAVFSNDHVIASGLTYGGTLTVVASGDPLAAGDTFDLFDWATLSGSFTAPINLPALPTGLAWDTSGLAVDGTIAVVASGGPELKFTLTGSRFELSWDPLATGYTLQSQTNALGQGINVGPGAWGDVLTGVNNNTYVVDPVPTNENVFYRLLQP